MRLALVANESSGAGGAGEVGARLERAGAEVRLLTLKQFCDGPEAVDADRLETLAGELRGRVAAGGSGGSGDGPAYDRVVVAGGDGSIGPAAALAARADLPLAVIPTGTANDFARTLDVPLDVDEACALAADPGAPTRTVELANAAGRPFVNAASAGLSVLAAENARPLKARLGPLAYALGALRAGLTGQPLHARVRTDGEEAWSGKAWQIVVAATGAFGGGSETGGVDPHDHQLDVAIVEAGPRLALARRAWGMKRGDLVEQGPVTHVRGRVIELDANHTEFNVDGEILRPDPLTFSVDGPIRVVVPR